MTPKRIFSLILLFFFSFGAWSQSRSDFFAKADSLKGSKDYPAYLNELRAISNRVQGTKNQEVQLKVRVRLLEYYNHMEFNSDSIKRLYTSGKALAKKYHNREYGTNFEMIWANYLVQRGDYTKALVLFQSAEEEIVTNNYSHLPYFYDSYAQLLYYLGEFPQAFSLLKKEAAILEKRKEFDNISAVYNNLGILYKSQNEMDSSLFYHWKSQEINVALQDTLSIIKSFNNIGFTYFNFNDLKSAEKYYQKAYNYAPEKATESLLTNYATLLLVKGENQKAERFLQNVVRSSQNQKLIKTALSQLVLLKKKEKKFEEALEYMEELSILSNKLLDETKVKEIERLKISYETAKKEQEINSLEAKNQAQETIIRKNQWLVVIVLIVLILTVAVFMLIARNRSNTNKIGRLRMEQRLFRSQMNPHFIFNVLSNIQTNILKRENDKAVKYLAKFSNLLRYNLEHANFETVVFHKELNAVVNYLDMQNLRLDGLLLYEIDVDASIENDLIEIPAMMLQPIVENAIEHGVEGIEKPKIEIKVTDHEQFIHCVIRDNGVGYSNTIKRESAAKKSFATEAIRKRLVYLSNRTGINLKYSIEDVLGEDRSIVGTKATIDLPILDESNKEKL